MNSPAQESESERLKELYYHIGVALITWQSVELEHFKLFYKLLGVRNAQVASVAYHSTESFEGRQKLVSRLISVLISDGEMNSTWSNDKGGLQTDIVEANKNRNKLAHYDLQREVISFNKSPDGGMSLELGEKRLQPSALNVVSRLIGNTPDKAAHNLDLNAVWNYGLQWQQLAFHINAFQSRVPLPPALEGAQLFLALPGGPLGEFHHILTRPDPKDPEPSDR